MRHRERRSQLNEQELSQLREDEARRLRERRSQLNDQERNQLREVDAMRHRQRSSQLDEQQRDESRQRRIQIQANYQMRRRNTTRYVARNYLTIVQRHSLAGMTLQCRHCNAKFFKEEKTSGAISSPEFSACCCKGDIKLAPLRAPPESCVINRLLNNESERKNIKGYNSALSFTSCGTKIDRTLERRGIFTYRIHGEMYHLIGSLLPPEGNQPSFLQIYFYDTDYQLNIRMNHFNNLNEEIMRELQTFLCENNPYVGLFKQALENMQSYPPNEVRLQIKADNPALDQRRYNLPLTTDIAVIMPGDGGENQRYRDIILSLNSNAGETLQRINQTPIL